MASSSRGLGSGVACLYDVVWDIYGINWTPPARGEDGWIQECFDYMREAARGDDNRDDEEDASADSRGDMTHYQVEHISSQVRGKHFGGVLVELCHEKASPHRFALFTRTDPPASTESSEANSVLLIGGGAPAQIEGRIKSYLEHVQTNEIGRSVRMNSRILQEQLETYLRDLYESGNSSEALIENVFPQLKLTLSIESLAGPELRHVNLMVRSDSAIKIMQRARSSGIPFLTLLCDHIATNTGLRLRTIDQLSKIDCKAFTAGGSTFKLSGRVVDVADLHQQRNLMIRLHVGFLEAVLDEATQGRSES